MDQADADDLAIIASLVGVGVIDGDTEMMSDGTTEGNSKGKERIDGKEVGPV